MKLKIVCILLHTFLVI